MMCAKGILRQEPPLYMCFEVEIIEMDEVQ